MKFYKIFGKLIKTQFFCCVDEKDFSFIESTSNPFDEKNIIKLRQPLDSDKADENYEFYAKIQKIDLRPKDVFLKNFDLEKDWVKQWIEYRKMDILYDMIFDKKDYKFLYNAYSKFKI
jgi:hypothetical protein